MKSLKCSHRVTDKGPQFQYACKQKVSKMVSSRRNQMSTSALTDERVVDISWSEKLSKANDTVLSTALVLLRSMVEMKMSEENSDNKQQRERA